MKKSLVMFATVTVVSIGSLFYSTPASADSLESLKNKEAQIQQERKELRENLSDVELEIADILIDLEEINVEISRITNALVENKQSLKNNEEDINHTQTEIEKLREEIIELEEAIEKRFEILKDRAVAYQKNGGSISYIEVLFGSKNFGDFIGRVTAISKVTDSDAALMEQIDADKIEVEKKQDVVEGKLGELKELKMELEGVQTLIRDQEKETKAKQAKFTEIEEELVDKVKELKLKDGELASLQKIVENNIAAFTHSPRPPVVPSSSMSNGNLSTLSKSNNQASSGYFAWPAVGGYISSYVGPRWGRNHNGIDIARPSNYNILAAADGVVTSASFSGGFGNKVEIQHSNGLKTLYAHLSSINVKVGQKVNTGTVIGIMGETGNSTGIHLHFEVRKNGALQNPMDYLK